MKNLAYKLKNFLFKFTKESRKFKRPSYTELRLYKEFIKTHKNKLILSFGAGRSGQNWFSKIFNSHDNWIGSSERFADYEAFYRYITYYNLPVNKKGFFDLIELSANRDMSLYQNSFIASPYWSFGMEEITNKIKPDFIMYNIRSPIKTIESFYKKGWYKDLEIHNIKDSPIIDITNNQYRSFSRIIPRKKEYINEWYNLTRIGKITWFWCEINKSLYFDFNNKINTNKFIIKLKDVDQNYDAYLKLSEKFNFQPIMKKKQFLDIINKAPNKGSMNKHFYKNWSKTEKKEFENIIRENFPFYDTMKTNL